VKRITTSEFVSKFRAARAAMERFMAAPPGKEPTTFVEFQTHALHGVLQNFKYEPLTEAEKAAAVDVVMRDGRDLKAMTDDEAREYFLTVRATVKTAKEPA